VFKLAHELASKSYKSDETRFVVHGTTGSNFIVIRALSKMFKKPKILCTRNIHKSVWHACDDYNIDLRFIDFEFNKEFEMFMPPSPGQILSSLEDNPETNVVLLSNPTYNGLSCKLKEVVKTIREFNNDIIIYVDEAWGAHFVFNDKLPLTAMECGADISVQSTHKQGGALQQTSMIHWKRGRINEEKLIDSYNTYTTTSPSYHLLASLDATRDAMESYGKEEIDKEIKYAKLFKDFLRKNTKIRLFDDYMDKWKEYIGGWDKTKILMSLKNYKLDGFKFNKELLKHNIITEKYSMNNIIFIVTFQIVKDLSNLIKTQVAFVDILKDVDLTKNKTLITFPKTDHKIYNKKGCHVVKLKDAVNKISAEHVIPYPPGIPLIIKGDVINKEVISYLQRIKREEIHIIKETSSNMLKIYGR